MGRRFFFMIIMTAVILWSCSENKGRMNDSADNAVLPQPDGTYSLSVAKAVCYNDVTNPSSNTAEWNIVVKESGRYKVWLSSATMDTLDLSYANPVKVHLMDNRLDVVPECDRIVLDSEEVSLPYYRADSYMGSFYISEPGQYTLQVISEKILPVEASNSQSSLSEDTRLMSVILTPMTR